MEGIDLGAEIRRIVSRLETVNPDLAATGRYQRAWRAVADPGALKHTDALYVVPGTDEREVIVYVDSQIWATELSLQAELLRLRLNMKLAEGRERVYSDDALFDYEQNEQIRRIQFLPSKAKYTHRTDTFADDHLDLDSKQEVDPVALDDAELAALYAETASIEDEKLRQAAFAAAKAHLELLKGKENPQ